MRADIIYALRTLRKNPGFTFVAVLSLALGIGANTAIFSLMNQVLLRLLPVEKPEEIVQLDHTGAQRGSTWNNKSWSYLMYKDLRDKTTSLSGLVAYFPSNFSFSEGGQTDRVHGEIVSGNFFQVLGVRPTLGRLLAPEDDLTPGAHPVAVITYGYWVQRYGSNPDVLNKKVLLNGMPYTIVGVTERGFPSLEFRRYADVFAPIAMKKQLTPTWNGLDDRRTLWLQVFGRLKPGVTREQAQAELNTIYHPIREMELQQIDRVSERFRKAFLDSKVLLLEGGRGSTNAENLKDPLVALMCMVAMVLLIACANLANLLLARSAGRRKEIAIRLAMGASRMQILRQLLVESIALGVLGGLAGLIVASWTVDFLMLSMTGDAQELVRGPHYFDWHVMAFNLVLSIVTGLIFGLIPAIQATRPDVVPALKDEAGSISASGAHVIFRKSLIAGQVALSLLLMIAAGLFARSLYNLKMMDPGFRAESLVQFEVDASLNAYDNNRTIDFYQRLQNALRNVPGTQGIGMSRAAIMDNDMNISSVSVQGYEAKEGEDMNPLVNTVGPDFFRTLGIPLIKGRDFNDRDVMNAPKVAVVNESFAKYFFKNDNPIGRRFQFGGRGEKIYNIEIVGLVKDSKHINLRDKPMRGVFIPYTQEDHMGGFVYYVRAKLDPAAIGASIRREVSRLDANMPVAHVRTLDEQISQSIMTERLASTLSIAFGGLATLLAAVGLYGVMAFIVARRTREIGIRMALGALQSNVIWLVMKEVAWMTGIGLAIGLPLAIAAGQLIESQLFGIHARDIAVIASSVFVLALVAALAGFVPARRATSVDPIRALRYE